MKIAIWKATESEPGCDGAKYELTKGEQPGEIEPIPVPDMLTGESDLVRDDSLYDDWEQVGEIECEEIYETKDGETCVVSRGVTMTAVDAALARRCT